MGVCFDLISCCRFDIIMIPGMSEKKYGRYHAVCRALLRRGEMVVCLLTF